MQRVLAMQRKWLAFRALEGRLQPLRRTQPQQPPRMAYVGLALSGAVVMGLCALNDAPFASNAPMRAIVQAGFCIVAAALYGLYMLLSTLERWVHSCADDAAGRSPYLYHYEHMELLNEIRAEEEEEAHDEPAEEEQDEGAAAAARRMLPREVVVSSMYLGGAGCFLAIPALCMWDRALSLAFILSLFLISLWDDYHHHHHHHHHQHHAPPLLLQWALRCLLALALVCVCAVEHAAPSGISSIIALEPLWPYLALSAMSPVMLRAGSGAVYVGGLYHSMTPMQTLETGLPVVLVFSGLVLSRFSPLEQAFVHDVRATAPVFGPMMVLVPVMLAAGLALLLFMLRRRATLVTSAVLLAILAVRQQLPWAPNRARLLTGLEIGAMLLCGLSLLVALLTLTAPPQPAARPKEEEVVMVEAQPAAAA